MFENEKPIQKDKLNNQVYDRLCTLLREGEFTPGEPVRVSRIAEAFGVSAMPVREALTRLAAVGVMANVSGRSVGVPMMTREELSDLRDVRLEIETKAVEWAVKNQTPEFVNELEVMLADLLQAEKVRDVRGFIKNNYAFHFRLYQQANSPVLMDIINTLWLRVSPHLYHADQRSRHRISNDNHKLIIDAVRGRDVETAQKALIADVTGSYDDLVLALFSATSA
ncbi:MAG: GntR family transcriptional regulator [Pseudomonadota bacterium]